jgi:hypothetical protein
MRPLLYGKRGRQHLWENAWFMSPDEKGLKINISTCT